MRLACRVQLSSGPDASCQPSLKPSSKPPSRSLGLMTGCSRLTPATTSQSAANERGCDRATVVHPLSKRSLPVGSRSPDDRRAVWPLNSTPGGIRHRSTSRYRLKRTHLAAERHDPGDGLGSQSGNPKTQEQEGRALTASHAANGGLEAEALRVARWGAPATKNDAVADCHTACLRATG